MTQEASRTNSSIFCRDGEVHVPARIDQILSILTGDENRGYFVAVHRHLPIPREMRDPFCKYRDYGASLWMECYSDNFDIIPLTQGKVCHAISMPWVAEILVIKALDRVSDRINDIKIQTYEVGRRLMAPKCIDQCNR